MPATPTGPWKNTPNKTDHNTKGYTSKVLLNYQVTGSTISIDNNAEIINTLISTNVNIKGSNSFAEKYFENADGRCFRITMYYLKPYDGGIVNLEQALYDLTNDVTYSFPTSFSGPIGSASGYNALVKYECYFSVFFDINNSTYIAQANGSIFYASKETGVDTVIIPMSSYSDLGGSIANRFQLRIKNINDSAIYPVSLMIEEIS
jgi:hypothetical protein